MRNLFKILLIVSFFSITSICNARLKAVSLWSPGLDSQNEIGFAVGDGGIIYKTTNGGSFWFLTNDTAINAGLNSVFTISGSIALAVGNNIIIKTTNGGFNWSQFSGFGSNLNSIYFLNSDTGIAVGTGGKILRTSNQGVNWVTISSPVGDDLNSVYFYKIPPPLYYAGVISGDNGKILVSIPSGLSWGPFPFPSSSYDLTSIAITGYTSPNFSAVVSSTSGIIFKTSNTGNNWSADTLTSASLNSIVFKTTNIGITVGNSGKIFRTENGGTSWTSITSPANLLNLYSVFFLDPFEGWACGGSDIIMHSTNSGVNWTTQHVGIETVSTLVPTDFSLKQNYPNPFNPSTSFEFDIPKRGPVRLILYNSIGQFVSELYNGDLSPGTYKVTSSFSSLPSGIYFYSLYGYKTRQTKRMVLVK